MTKPRHLKLHLLFVATLLLSLQIVQGQEFDTPTEQREEIEATPVMHFLGRKVVLLWSEELGYVHGRSAYDYTQMPELRTPNQVVKCGGKWGEMNGTRHFFIDEVEVLETPGTIPPIEPTPSDLRNPDIDVARRIQVEGIVQHCLDRGYLLEIHLRVGDRLALFMYKTGSEKRKNSFLPGRKISVTGYLWNSNYRFYNDFPYAICASGWKSTKLLSPTPSEQNAEQEGPFPVQTFQQMRFSGSDQEGTQLFYRENPPMVMGLNLGPLQIGEGVLSRGCEYQIEAVLNDEKRGYPYGESRRIRLTKHGFPHPKPIRFTKNSPPPLGRSSSFTGRIQSLDQLPTGHLVISMKNQGNQSFELTGISANHKNNWPNLDLAVNDLIAITGLFQGNNETTQVPELIIRKSGSINILTPERVGKNWSPYLMAMGGGLGWCILWVALLRRAVRQRTREARNSEAKLMAVYHSVPHGLVAVDHQQKIFGSNRALSDLFGIGELKGKPFSNLGVNIRELTIAPTQWDKFLTRMIKTPGGTMEFSVRDHVDAKNIRNVEVQVEPIAGEDTKGTIWLFRDLTEKHELEESLAHSRKLEAIGRLSGGIAHDFNNLLTGVTGNLSLLELEMKEASPECRDFLKGASTAAKDAAGLVRQLLDYSKQNNLEVRNCSVNEIMVNLYDILRHMVDARITLDIQLADDLLSTRVDPVKIEQVLMNLVLNAINAMSDGGKVSIRTCNTLDPASGQIVKVTVTDNGPGIPPDVLENIFDPYFTTKSEDGHGLGLSTSLAVIEQHEGTLTCSSTLGQGATFTITLPANREAPEPIKNIPRGQPTKSEDLPRGQHVMVIDDEPTVLLIMKTIMKTMLEREGFNVASFPNGQPALEYLHSGENHVDLIISDNSMPVMDGMQTYEEVRKLDPSLPFIVSSGYLIDLKDYADRANGVEPEAFIQKPLHVKSFIESVREVLADKALPA